MTTEDREPDTLSDLVAPVVRELPAEESRRCAQAMRATLERLRAAPVADLAWHPDAVG